MTFKLPTKGTAPSESKPLLDGSLKDFGMIPNLHAAMAEAPKVLEACKVLHELFQVSSFNNEELTVIWQTINVEHEYHYCVPAHTTGVKMMRVDDAITEALRNSTPLPTNKLGVLREATLALVRERGKPGKQVLTAFYNAGYEKQQLLEIVLGISQKVMSNYINHFSETPVDKAFESFVWSK